jgi:hypothetical protein
VLGARIWVFETKCEICGPLRVFHEVFKGSKETIEMTVIREVINMVSNNMEWFPHCSFFCFCFFFRMERIMKFFFPSKNIQIFKIHNYFFGSFRKIKLNTNALVVSYFNFINTCNSSISSLFFSKYTSYRLSTPRFLTFDSFPPHFNIYLLLFHYNNNTNPL